MRRLAEALGIRAPSLYKHFPDKAAVEVALMQIGLQEAGAAAPLMLVMGGDLDRARAPWGMAHGLVLLELHGRLPADADIDAAWRVGVRAFGAARPRSATRKEASA
jgi:AcrR family transcriptional regulator